MTGRDLQVRVGLASAVVSIDGGLRLRLNPPHELRNKKGSEIVMKFDFERLNEDTRYKLMLATVLPRPIAWVTSQDSNGLVNAAPFSFFNVFGTEPCHGRDWSGPQFADTPKDTCLNIRATEEFVVNLVPFSSAEKMRASSMPFPPYVSEVSAVGLQTSPSERVAPPRISESPASFECKFMQEVRLGNFSLILGRIVMLHVRDEAVFDADRLHIDADNMDLIGRMEGALYTRTRDKFEPGVELAQSLLAKHKG
jgi:flavin reductase (DIM6/NTAB) family NADH-FMN oxidoreductase RutF